jgi:cell pole-organizing protein PopZ
MSAVNAKTTPSSLDEERRAHEPSMEEILASIRRIIADDDHLPPPRKDRQERPMQERPASAQAAYSRPALEPRDHSRRPSQDILASRESLAPEPPVTEPSPFRSTHDDDCFGLSARAEPRFDAPMEPPARAHDDEPAAEPPTDAFDPSRDDAGHDRYAEFVETLGADEPADANYYEEAPAAEEPAPVDAPGAALVSPDAAASIATHFQALAASMVINDSGLLHDYAREMLRPMLKQWLDDNLPVMVERLVRAEIERVARGRR